MTVFELLPESYQSTLLEGYHRNALLNMTKEELLSCFQNHLNDLVDEGVISRKDAKSKTKHLVKILKKIEE